MSRITSVAAPVYAFWCRHPSRRNFGDALTPWLVKRIVGQHPTFVAPDAPVDKYLLVGSIAGYAGERSTLWGAGIVSRDEVLSPLASFRAVRGPLTRARALECGADCPEVYGDPALLLPRFHRSAQVPRGGVGVVPHYLDKAQLEARWRPSAELRLIDIQGPIEDVIDSIASCELVISSSLHGIITAHAYGVPAVWVEFGDLRFGDRSKFRDYQLSVGHEPRPPVSLRDADPDPDALAPRAAAADLALDVDALWRACPLREIAQ